MSSTPNQSGSLADRISKPLNAVSTSFTPSSSTIPAATTTSWADEVASPTTTTGAVPDSTLDATTVAKDTVKDDIPQTDGATEPQEGSSLEDSHYEVQVKLADLQADTNNPLFSAVTFTDLNLNENILKAIHSMGYQKPSKIQSKALPLMLMDPPRNMIAQSQSGTGKTAAFVITILSRLDYTKPQSPQAICLAPSRELARQIEGVFRVIGQFIPGLTIQAAVPGAVERGAKVQAMIVVGTPGTAMDLIKRRQLDTSLLRIMCLDEADNMLDQQGLGEQCMRVRQMLPRLNQILLFSATFPDEVNNYAAQFAPEANAIRLERNNLTVSGIKQMYIDCSEAKDHKYKVLVMLYEVMQIGSSIIFVKTRDTADRISAALQSEGHKVVAVHGAFDGAERDSILNDFRNGKSKVLITTNVLARGIDVQSVSMVINYDIPTKGRSDEPDAETYLHRIGRTGRFGRVGVSISFIFDRKSFQALAAIAQEYGIDLLQLDPNNKEDMEEQITKVLKSSRAQPTFK